MASSLSTSSDDSDDIFDLIDKEGYISDSISSSPDESTRREKELWTNISPPLIENDQSTAADMNGETDRKRLLKLIDEGDSLAKLGKHNEAIEYLQNARKLSASLDESAIEWECLYKLGVEYLVTSEPLEAIRKFRQYLLIACKLNDRQGQRRSHKAMIQAFRSENNHYAAYNHLVEYITLCEELCDVSEKEWAEKLKQELNLLIEKDESASNERSSLQTSLCAPNNIDLENVESKPENTSCGKIQRPLPDAVFHEKNWENQHNICKNLFNLKQFSKALKYSKKNLVIAKFYSNDKRLEVISMLLHSTILKELGKFDEAIQSYSNLLALGNELDTKTYYGAALVQLELLYLQKIKEISDQDGCILEKECAVYNLKEYRRKRIDLWCANRYHFIPNQNLAEIYHYSGGYKYAIATYTEILKMMNIVGDSTEKLEIQIGLGHSYYLDNNFDAAHTHYSQSLKMFSDSSTRGLRSLIYYNLHKINRSITNNIDAVENLYSYLFINEKLDNDIGLLLAYESLCDILGNMHHSSNNKALKYAYLYKAYSEKLNFRDDYTNAEQIIQKLEERVQSRQEIDSIGAKPKPRSSTSQMDDDKISLYSIWADRNCEAEKEENENNFVRAKELYNENLSLARDLLKNPCSVCKTLLSLGRIEVQLNDFDEAIQRLNQAKELAQKNNEAELKGCVYHELGFIYHTKACQLLKENAIDKYELQSNYRRAINYYEKALKTRVYRFELTNIYEILGNVCLQIDDYSWALHYFEKKLDAALDLNDTVSEAEAYTDLSKSELLFQNTERSIEFNKKAYQLSEILDDQISKAKICYNIGNSYYFLGDLQKSFEYIELYLKLSRNLNDTCGQALAYFSLSYLSICLRNYQSAIEYADFHYTFATELNDKNGQCNAIKNRECAEYLLNKTIFV